MKTRSLFSAIVLAAWILGFVIAPAFGQRINKQRLVVLSDIEADPDDTQSLIRLLLYSNEIDIEGLIATTSIHQQSGVYPKSISSAVQAYGQVQPNLLKHAPGYPTSGNLLKLIKSGQGSYGMASVGEGKDTEGSNWVIQALEKQDNRPLWVSVWGGANTLAQALWKLKNSKTDSQLNELIKKLRVYAISDQDNSGNWIRSNFPSLFFIVTPGGYGKATWTGINSYIKGIDNQTISNKWLAENIQRDHGPLGLLYPDVAYGMEGDTPSWLSLIPNGLNNPEHPDWGGWGGRYEFYKPRLSDLDEKGFTGGVPVVAETGPIWTNASDSYSPIVSRDYGRAVTFDTTTFKDNKVTLWRWRDDFQNDFAGRMDWTVKDYKNANHPPLPALAHADTIRIKSGSYFVLDATGTSDPDGDHLSFLWFQYQEAGSYKDRITFAQAENLYRLSAKAPEVSTTETAHFILRVTDKGNPALTRYRRVIVYISPK
ncbi:DUF1593 domain-containing protein [Dyadobacter sp. NIV53]|uniref:DUF1593 domain-containing protein n=1 Tax=Dyadobacter sp. NIV53 TaxID=2861765 RepID=UPI001C88039B|nr:DUF1593 domain-containing protein [Dyadobacter sp. NIV53]